MLTGRGISSGAAGSDIDPGKRRQVFKGGINLTMAKAGKSRSRTADAKGPHPIDIHVGNRLRQQRTLLGFSQEKLGEAVGLTFQQIQKYERGSNRIGASRLHEFSQILEVPVSFFFDDLNGAPAKTGDRRGRKMNGGPRRDDFLQKRETLELVRAYYRIPDTAVRKRLFETIKAVAKSAGDKA